MIIAILVLSLGLIICVTLILFLKRELRNAADMLKMINKFDSNKRLTTETFDKTVCLLIEQVNETLDIKKAAMLKYNKSNDELKRAITNISHDLRTPLTSVIGYLQMLKSEELSAETREKYLYVMEDRLKYLSYLMNNLFEYTRILEGKMSVNLEKINICNVLREGLSANYQSFVDKGFEVVVNIPDKPVYCMCDTNVLSRITQNLIQNVLVHGNGYFELTVDETEGKVLFKNSVKNIDEIDTARLFERFYTADTSRNAKTTGLGLAIVKELLVGMGAEISAYVEDDMLCLCLIPVLCR